MEQQRHIAWQRASCPLRGRSRLLGERTLPHKLQFRGTTVGGFSGVDYDPRTGRYLLVSDDRSAVDPARRSTRPRSNWTPAGFMTSCSPGSRFFRRPDGQVYPSLDEWAMEQFDFGPRDRNVFGTGVDPEEIRVDPRTGSMLWSQEGILAEPSPGQRIVVDPALRISTADGRFLRDPADTTRTCWAREGSGRGRTTPSRA